MVVTEGFKGRDPQSRGVSESGSGLLMVVEERVERIGIEKKPVLL